MKNILSIFLFFLMPMCIWGQAYRVGDLYTAPDGSKGIVFFVLPDGTGGWVVALNDASTGCTWGDDSDIPDLTNNGYGITDYLQVYWDTAGYQNTAIIRDYQNNNPYYAAGKVDFANGWYLPSPGQLSMLFAQLPFIDSAIVNAGGNLMAPAWYWASAESSSNSACRVDFGESNSTNSDGQYEFHLKSNTHRVRAVRSFSYQTDVELSYIWNTGDNTPDITVTPTQTTTYTIIVSTIGGCADTVEHTIVVGASSNEEISQFACDSYEWNGQTYNQSGDYSVYYQNTTGCDSVVTLHLTIEPTPEATITTSSDVICEGNEVVLQTVATIHNTSIAVGDILCTDNSIVKIADWPVSDKTAMGIVFYVDNTGEHGWAVHLHDQATSVHWTPYDLITDVSTLTNYINARDAIMDIDGYSNTQIILNAGDATRYPAAYAVDFANGWYLPAAGQVRLLYGEMVTMNSSLQVVEGTQFSMDTYSSHWSSTERGYDIAWGVNAQGDVYHSFKWDHRNVRSVRDF
jgi:hypothetical protein